VERRYNNAWSVKRRWNNTPNVDGVGVWRGVIIMLGV
jgi:hypothetical protein